MTITREHKDELDLLGFKVNIINQQLTVQQCRIEDLDLEKSKLVKDLDVIVGDSKTLRVYEMAMLDIRIASLQECYLFMANMKEVIREEHDEKRVRYRS